MHATASLLAEAIDIAAVHDPSIEVARQREDMDSRISFRRLCCCCACTKEKEDDNPPSEEVDYLLPGGEWDPSRSSLVSNIHRSTHAAKRSPKHSLWRRGSGGREESAAGAYIPPDVPGATSIPKFNHFKMLKTIGKGTFGKVCVDLYNGYVYVLLQIVTVILFLLCR